MYIKHIYNICIHTHTLYNRIKSTLRQVSTKEPVSSMQVRLTKSSPKLIVLRLSVVGLVCQLARISLAQLNS